MSTTAKSGFTLIELMIVVAIIAIIAAIAIPNLIESRMQANETNAVAALREYVSAQYDYQKANYAVPNGGSAHSFCDDFSRLGGTNAYVKQSSDKLELIPAVFAAATSTTIGYQGYFFTNDQNVAAASWKYYFGLYADPCDYGKTGINSYYVSSTGTVKMKDLGGSPSSGTATIDSSWIVP